MTVLKQQAWPFPGLSGFLSHRVIPPSCTYSHHDANHNVTQNAMLLTLHNCKLNKFLFFVHYLSSGIVTAMKI